MAHVLASSSQRAGDSSDSDAEIDTSSGNENRSKHHAKGAVVVLGEAPESDDDINFAEDSLEALSKSRTVIGIDSSGHYPPPPPTPVNASEAASDSTNGLKYNTILHRKLREKNEHLKKELMAIACNPYNDATREIKTLTQQLIKSQRMVQGVSTTLRRVSRDMIQLEESVAALRSQSGQGRIFRRTSMNGTIPIRDELGGCQDSFDSETSGVSIGIEAIE